MWGTIAKSALTVAATTGAAALTAVVATDAYMSIRSGTGWMRKYAGSNSSGGSTKKTTTTKKTTVSARRVRSKAAVPTRHRATG